MALQKGTLKRHDYVPIDTAAVNRITDAVMRALEYEQPPVVNEAALIVAYARISEGVRSYPADHKSARVNVLFDRMSRALADAVVEIGKLPARDVLTAASLLSADPRSTH